MTRTLLSATALALLVAAPVSAQPADRAAPAADRSAAAAKPAVVQQTSQIDSSRLIGRNIVNPQGERIGEVDSVLIGRDGRIQAVIVGVGGFLGIGEHKVAIDWNDIQVMDNGERVVAGMTKDQLKAMPEFRYAADRDTPRDRTADAPRDRTADAPRDRTADAPRDRTATAPATTAATTAASTAAPAAPVTTAQTRAERPAAPVAPAARTEAPAVAEARVTAATSTPASLGRLRADELIGKNVVNARGETVGEIEDIVIDNNKAVHVILSVGGFLGLGDRDVAVPFDQLRLNQNNAILMSEASQDQLKQMPEYKKGDTWRAVDRTQPVVGR